MLLPSSIVLPSRMPYICILVAVLLSCSSTVQASKTKAQSKLRAHRQQGPDRSIDGRPRTHRDVDQTKVSTDKTCYEHGESIVAMFINQFPQYDDRISFHPASEPDEGGTTPSSPSVWVHTCNHETHSDVAKCPQWGKFSFHFRDFPLPSGAYQIALTRERNSDGHGSNDVSTDVDSFIDSQEDPKYQTMVESHAFIVRAEGEECDGKTVPVAVAEGQGRQQQGNHHHHHHHHHHRHDHHHDGENIGSLRGSNGAVVVRVAAPEQQ